MNPDEVITPHPSLLAAAAALNVWSPGIITPAGLYMITHTLSIFLSPPFGGGGMLSVSELITHAQKVYTKTSNTGVGAVGYLIPRDFVITREIKKGL